jgi:hypothetical protein
MIMRPGYWFAPLLVGLLATAPFASSADAQTPMHEVPINNFTGKIALDWNVDQFYSGVNDLLGATSDGIERMTGRKNPKAHESAPLDDLRPGMPVVVHYTVKGILASADDTDGIAPDRSKHNEGTVAAVDRNKDRVTIRFADGGTETLRRAHHVAESDEHSRVIVSYSDEAGRRTARVFKPAER